jgi:pimeloyl-ACP methyl ester carboxylesterase
MKSLDGKTQGTQGYARVNGLKMYYEIEGVGDPLVYIPPAFGFAGLKSFPALAQSHSVIAVDLQGHGRTADIPDRPLSIQQYAKDVVGLLKYLEISKADFFGESYGGATATMIAVRYPELVGRVATSGATFGPLQTAHNVEMLRFDHPPTPDSRDIQFRKRATRKYLLIVITGPRFGEKLSASNGKGFRAKSWLQSKRQFSLPSEITILSALNTRLRHSRLSPTPSLL